MQTLLWALVIRNPAWALVYLIDVGIILALMVEIVKFWRERH